MDQVRHGNDGTLSRKSIQYMEYLASEYELTKAKKHSRYKFATDFYKAHSLKRQNFLKYYNRYKQSNN